MTNETKDGWIWSFLTHIRSKKNDKRMRAMEILALGGKCSVALIECDGHSYLVGCGAEAVNCIVPIAQAEALGNEMPVRLTASHSGLSELWRTAPVGED